MPFEIVRWQVRVMELHPNGDQTHTSYQNAKTKENIVHASSYMSFDIGGVHIGQQMFTIQGILFFYSHL